MNQDIKAIKDLENLIKTSNAECRKEVSNIQLRNRLTVGRLNREIDEIKKSLSEEELEQLNETRKVF